MDMRALLISRLALLEYTVCIVHMLCMWLADVGCETEEEIAPAAVELCLPWRRNTGREPVSSVETHMVADGSRPLRADGGNWMKGLTHSLSDSQSDNQSCNEDHVCDPLDIEVDEETTDQTTPLCSPNDHALALNCGCNVPSDAKPAEAKINDVRNVVNLPPVRKNSRHSEIQTALHIQQSVTRLTVRRRPTRCGSFPSSMDAACRAVDNESETEVAASLLPWRYASDERAIPDQQAPRPAAETHTSVVSMNSSAQSFVDAVSTYPQPSCQSFRLSEAESRHSEPVHVQHVIDFMSTGHRVTSAASDLDDDESSDILCNLEQLDSNERICMWLDTLSESNDEAPPEVDTIYSGEVL